MEIIKHIKSIRFSHAENGVAFYKDENGDSWYPQRDKLADDKPIIIVDMETNNIVSYWLGDPTRVGLPLPVPLNVVDVIQADEFPFSSVDEIYQDNYKFIDGQVVKTETSHEALVEQAEAERSLRLKVAGDAISPLQDAVDLDIATDIEIAMLNAWKKYRVLLNRVDTETAPDISWPNEPDKEEIVKIIEMKSK
ncbi:tail fiber assembly protein (plasmid) [Buttiauxella sp. WJP83]|uniref:tail fiber assembly protein n=1 Tax=Buttiauxella sp. WJP83 TaxID=2986951 RepID=UPI0022DE1805|nr:tail fiber assembly protein [Buttiauxella sp. WJP83]WBM73007.1 tail fiber assembly protein [Buttiauxella sp. WJP83]